MTTKQYLLDTNILVEFVHGNVQIIDRIKRVGFKRCCISPISLHELYYGAYNALEKKKEYFSQEMERIARIRERFDLLPLQEEADDYAKIKVRLRNTGKIVDEFDMVIAGQAVDAGLTVVTDNVKHFENMPGAKIENWRER